MQVRLARAQPVDQILVGRLRRVARRRGSMARSMQRAGRLAVGVAHDPAARRIGRARGRSPRSARARELTQATWPSSLSKTPGDPERWHRAALGPARRSGRPATTSRCRDPLPLRVRGRVRRDRVEVRGRIGQLVKVAAPREHARRRSDGHARPGIPAAASRLRARPLAFPARSARAPHASSRPR